MKTTPHRIEACWQAKLAIQGFGMQVASELVNHGDNPVVALDVFNDLAESLTVRDPVVRVATACQVLAAAIEVKA